MKGAWPEELTNVLWAYRTTARTPTAETPFRLTYGTEAVIPVEVGVSSIKRGTFSEGLNDDELRLNLDFLDEVRDNASNKMIKYQKRMVEYYNKRVKLILLKHKSQTQAILEQFYLMIEAQFCRKIKCIRTDNGTEFKIGRAHV